MGSASHGGTCPLCGNYAAFTRTGRLYRHTGNDRVPAGSRRLWCKASRTTPDVARRMRANRDAGRHAYRNEDGSWLYICDRCGREQHPWPLVRPPGCAPKDWAHCIRELSQLQIKEARNNGNATGAQPDR